MSENKEANSTRAISIPFQKDNTLYVNLASSYNAFVGVMPNLWTSWKYEQNIWQFILPYKPEPQLGFFSTFNRITISNMANPSNRYVIRSGAPIGVIGIDYDAHYCIEGTDFVFKFCITSSDGALAIMTTNKEYNYQNNWDDICNDRTKSTFAISASVTRDTIDIPNRHKIKKMQGMGHEPEWEKPKKPFLLNYESDCSDHMGLPSSDTFSLLANYQDGTFMRTRLLYDMADESGVPFTPDGRFVDAYINGDYKGAYQITQTPRIGDNRLVQVSDLEKETMEQARKATGDPNYDVYAVYGTDAYHSKNVAYNGGTINFFRIPSNYVPTDTSGGYLLHLDTIENEGYETIGNMFISPRGQRVNVVSPAYCSETQMKSIFNYYNKMEDAIYTKNTAYAQYIDTESLAKTYLVHEISKNIDGGIDDTYFYKDKGTHKFFAGPVWSFDCAIGNLVDYYNGQPAGVRPDIYGRMYRVQESEGWFTREIAITDHTSERTLYTAACEIDSFWKVVESVWSNKFNHAVKVALGEEQATGNRLTSIDNFANILRDFMDVNYVFYPSLGTMGWIPFKEKTFDEQVRELKSWLKNRYNWMAPKINDGMNRHYYLKKSGWKEPYAYTYPVGNEIDPEDWPGGKMVDEGDNIYSITVEPDDLKIIFSDHGSPQTKDLDTPKNDYMVYDPDLGEGGEWYPKK